MTDTIRPPSFEDRLDRDEREFDDALRERLKLAFEREVKTTEDAYGFDDKRARSFLLDARPPRLIDHLLRTLSEVTPETPDTPASDASESPASASV